MVSRPSGPTRARHPRVSHRELSQVCEQAHLTGLAPARRGTRRGSGRAEGDTPRTRRRPRWPDRGDRPRWARRRTERPAFWRAPCRCHDRRSCIPHRRWRRTPSSAPDKATESRHAWARWHGSVVSGARTEQELVAERKARASEMERSIARQDHCGRTRAVTRARPRAVEGSRPAAISAPGTSRGSPPGPTGSRPPRRRGCGAKVAEHLVEPGLVSRGVQRLQGCRVFGRGHLGDQS